MFSLETYDSTTFATHVVLSNSLSILIEGQFPVAIPLRE